MNVIARLEYELAYYDSAAHRFNHYTTRTPPTAGKPAFPLPLNIMTTFPHPVNVMTVFRSPVNKMTSFPYSVNLMTTFPYPVNVVIAYPFLVNLPISGEPCHSFLISYPLPVSLMTAFPTGEPVDWQQRVNRHENSDGRWEKLFRKNLGVLKRDNRPVG